MRIYLLGILGIGTVLFIWFLSTKKGSGWIWRYAFRLRTNNNTRAGLLWIITCMLFICRLLVCTTENQWPIGLDVSTPHYSERTQKFLKLYEQTIAEPATIGNTAKKIIHDVSVQVSRTTHDVYYGVCLFLGYTVFFLFVFSIIYTIVALRDEFMSALEHAKDRVFGHRSGEQNLPDIRPQTPSVQAQQQSEPANMTNAIRQPLRLSHYLQYEFIFALLGELMNVFIHRRRP